MLINIATKRKGERDFKYLKYKYISIQILKRIMGRHL